MILARSAILLFSLLLSGFSVGISGQSVLNLQPAPAQNRISENANRCMMMDSKGYLWIGTIDGLNRYDGYRFQIYQNDSRDSMSISGNYITAICEDSLHNLWIGTENGINLYDPLKDGFTKFKTTPEYPLNPAEDYINNIISDRNNQLWIAAYGGGLAYYDYYERQFIRIPVDTAGEPGAIIHHDVTALSNPDDTGFWLGYQNGMISRFENGHFVHYPGLEINQSIRDLMVDGNNHLWMGTDAGIYCFDPAAGKISKYHDGLTWDIYEIDNKIWMNVNFAGIYEWNSAENTLLPVQTFLDGRPITGDVKAYFQDEQGIIWGSYHGLFKQDPYENRFRCVRFEKGNPNSLSEPFVAGIAEDEKGNWVVLTVAKGLNYYDRQTMQWLNHKNHPWFDNELLGLRFSRLGVSGNMAHILTQDAVYTFDLNNGDLKKFLHPKIGEGLNPVIVSVSKEECWVGSSGLFLLNINTGVLNEYTPEYDSDAERRFLVFATPGKEIWAFDGNSIFHWENDQDFFDQKFEILESENENVEFALSFAKDPAGRFWIGQRNGLKLFDPIKNIQKHFTIADGLPSNVINSILIDEENHLWLGTNNGLSRFNPSSGHFRNYDKHDGVQDEIFLGNAAFKSKDGLLYFGGVNGFNVFHPDSISKTNPYPPKILISDLKVFNKPVVPGSNSILSKHISDTDELILSYKQSTISFELLALGYSQSEKNQYAYMIEGVDPDWNYTGTNQTASYTGLPRGEQLLLKVKAANHDGIWTENPTVLKIYIRPPAWETTWFRFLVLLFLFGVILFYNRWRVRQIKQRNLWLEWEVKKHTEELEDRAAKLRKANTELEEKTATIREQVEELNQLYRSQSAFFTSLSHEFRTPLTLLLGHLDELVQSNEPEKVVHKLTSRMQLSARQLLHLVNQIMDSAKLETGQYKLRVSKGDLLNYILNLAHAFQIPANKKGLDLQIDIRNTSLRDCWFDQDIIDKVFNNLLSNALKYTDKGSIRITLNSLSSPLSSKKAELIVEDTGRGISEDLLPFIFNRFYRVEGSLSMRKEGTGIGLSLVKQLIKLHKGHIEVSSKIEKGTLFRIYIPVDKTAFTEEEQTRSPVEPLASIVKWDEPKDTEELVGNIKVNRDKEDGPLVMIVEDNTEIRSFLHRQLAPKYKISEADNGRSAWKGIIKQIPDLIVGDIIMPGFDGFQLCRKVKSDIRTSHIPVILLTALSEQEKKMEGLKHGADAYICKPFSREELLLRVSNLIRHKEKLRERFLNEYYLSHLPDGLNKMDQVFLSELNSIIERDLLDEHMGVSELTKALGISRTQLFRKLKSLTGMSATEYIRDYRLRKAYELLNSENMTVSEVIYATGFRSRSYFYNSFKKKFNVPPKQLLKNRSKPKLSK